MYVFTYTHIYIHIYTYTRISGRYAPFILGPAGGSPEVVASPRFWGSLPPFWPPENLKCEK